MSAYGNGEALAAEVVVVAHWCTGWKWRNFYPLRQRPKASGTNNMHRQGFLVLLAPVPERAVLWCCAIVLLAFRHICRLWENNSTRPLLHSQSIRRIAYLSTRYFRMGWTIPGFSPRPGTGGVLEGFSSKSFAARKNMGRYPGDGSCARV